MAAIREGWGCAGIEILRAAQYRPSGLNCRWRCPTTLTLTLIPYNCCPCLLQSMKDGLIVTSCGAEALPFISAVGVLPATIAFFFFYGKVVSMGAVSHIL